MDVTWDGSLNQWHGDCPRCGKAGFFTSVNNATYGNTSMVVVRCPGKHLFVIEYVYDNPNLALDSFPVERTNLIPAWLPDDYHECYVELLKNVYRNHFRSVIALSGILLEGAVNELITTVGDKGKSLFDRLEGLKNKGTIDPDQFSDATIARLTRRGVIHPKDITSAPTPEDAKEVFESVNYFLEKIYKPRASRALKAPKEIT
ncbi:MAG: DUF4145 domain-containing protein [Patescibacteria group bacterium]